MKKYLLLFSIFSSSFTFGDYSCSGQVAYLGVASDNSLNVSNGYGIHKLCVLDSETQSEGCKAWMSMAMSAQAQNRNIAIYYKDSTGKASNEENCNSIGNWVEPSDTVYFLRLK